MVEADAEINEIRATQARYENTKNIFQLLMKKSILINGCSSILILAFRCGAGRFPMMADPRDFFDSFDLPLTFKTLNIIQGIMELGSSVLYTTIADRVKRKPILQVCCWLINISLLIVIFMDLLKPAIHPTDKWIVLVGLFVYYGVIVGFLLSASSVVVSEIASSCTEARSPITSIAYFVHDLLGAITVEIFPFALRRVGVDWIMTFFIISSCFLSFTIHFIPETIGRGLHNCGEKTNKNSDDDTKL